MKTPFSGLAATLKDFLGLKSKTKGEATKTGSQKSNSSRINNLFGYYFKNSDKAKADSRQSSKLSTFIYDPTDYFAQPSDPTLHTPSTPVKKERENESVSTTSETADSIFDPITEFKADIFKRSNDVELRQEYLKRLPKQNNKALLTATHLEKIYKFMLSNPDFLRDLENLQPGQTKIYPKAAGRAKVQVTGVKRYRDLPRSIQVTKTKDGLIEVRALIQSKIADDSKDPELKKAGVFKKVTYEVLLNPVSEQQKLIKVSKKELLGSSKEDQEKKRAEIQRENEMFNKTGVDTSIGPEHIDSKGNLAVRVSEERAIASLDELLVPAKITGLLKKDADFRENDPKSRDVILLRLIGDILEHMDKIHKAGIIHNDVKDPNMLIYVDDAGHLRAKNSDFGLSSYEHERLSDQEIFQLDKSKWLTAFKRALPVATSTYASPQVVGCYRSREKAEKYVAYSLMDSIAKFPCYGRELYYARDKAKHPEQQFIDLRCDPKDDMFSVGVTLFMLVTGGYPTNTNERRDAVNIKYYDQNHQKQYYSVPYQNVEQALAYNPLANQLAPLFRGLFAPTREERLSAEAAKKLLDESLRSHMREQQHVTNRS